ncbi:MAG: glycosyltransferase family 4 protein [Chloroherpetonaceae bacterium]|nr:glycosyltransferase family 4 protein [Chthonomonadaceae bacterium]MDW8208172.1 glycosyltransferase family 4 protein [Chloroherpetonaceae bacterium]
MMVRPAAGGIRSHVATLLTLLPASRFRIDLMAPHDFTLPDFVPEVPHCVVPLHARTNPLADWRALRECTQILARHRYHLLHAHGLRAGLIGAMAARQAGIPTVCTAHNLIAPPSLLERLFFWLTVRQVHCWIAVSQAVRDQLVAIGAPHDAIRVIPNGVDLARCVPRYPGSAVRTQYGVPQEAPLIVALGRLSREKGFDVLIEAMRGVWAQIPEAHLVLAGSGPEEMTLRRLTQGNHRIVMPGFVESSCDLLAAADVVAVPSRLEGQGLTALEAMAARKPVVATQVGGLTETVLEGVTGRLVPPENPTALASALLELLADPARRATMGEAGRRRVEREFPATRMVAQVETVYRDVLEQNEQQC